MISNSQENLQAYGTGKNISSDSIVTPRERNDSAFLREKCRPGISPPSTPSESRSLAREKSAGDERRGPERTKVEERNSSRDVSRERERTGRKRPSELLHTWRQSRHIHARARAFARVRAYVFIATVILSTQRERERRRKGRDRITHACVRIIGVKHVSVV